MKFTRRRGLASVLAITLGLCWWIAWKDHLGDEEVVLRSLREDRSSAQAVSAGGQGRVKPGSTPDLERDPILDAAADPFKVVHFGAPLSIVAAPAAPPPVVEAKPVMPAFPYRYFGRMVTAEGVTLTFLSRDDSLVPITAAAILEDVYRVDAVGEKEVLLTYLPLNEKITIQAQSGKQ